MIIVKTDSVLLFYICVFLIYITIDVINCMYDASNAECSAKVQERCKTG